MSYVDLATVHVPATGDVAPAAWGLQIRENQEFLVDPPACNAFNSSAQTVPDATSTILTANSEVYDTDGMHSTVSNTSRITIQTEGRYLFFAVADAASGASAVWSISFWVNGVQQNGTPIGQITNLFGGGLTLPRSFDLVVGDYVQVVGFHAVGSSHDIHLHEFSAVFLTR